MQVLPAPCPLDQPYTLGARNAWIWAMEPILRQGEQEEAALLRKKGQSLPMLQGWGLP